ncbi:outer membrane protein assembly factor BamD [Aeoliella mucimassa]|uniref:Tetratricopeptide repeat protein n=1 Tax=Aeoliella mucimassa TaxID=2527972 RepID=A0A518AUX0_9BACT|nr:hypothetical protein [Aeoliella mucimassa]QDU58516.1 Tetratricopeptide repeat protein [Aeoliella mucimassa]
MRRPGYLTCIVTVGLLASLAVGCKSSSDPPDFGNAGELYMEAQKALNSGDTEQAITLLSQSIEADPMVWAYRDRAWLYAKADRDDDAKADIEKGMELSPGDYELTWLQGELAKPKGKRQLDKRPQATK